MLQFLEDYEAAFMNIEYVKKKQQLSGTDSGERLHNDQGKRAIFVRNFHLPNITDTLIEDVELHTSTWAEMVDVLRRKIARRTANALTTSRSKAHTVSTDEDLQSLVYALSADWNVGYKLWKTLEEDLRQRITKTRRDHLPMNSGGGTTASPKCFNFLSKSKFTSKYSLRKQRHSKSYTSFNQPSNN